MSNEHLAILGGGNMGRALIGGLLRRGTRPEHIVVAERLAAARESLSRDFGILASEDSRSAVAAASLIVLAVKPQDAQAALTAVRPLLQKNRPLLVSVAAGIRLSALESWCGAEVPVVRSMPNRPALVGAGATGLFAPAHIAAVHRERAERVMQAVGEVVWVASEDELDLVTALSGSGPAYFFLLAELLMQGATELGLDAAVARKLALATLQGAGQLASVGDGDLRRMRAEVTSKGGTTQAAVEVLEAADLRAIVTSAMQAAARRSRQIAAQFGTDHPTGNP
ncbi:MAG TPA: pyrroline-5-carboxylate reductase [Steroidobacteraceae bacterium]|nr:pyrroline-5-carboxylate reductase [Steroidobacteraceae bacterium]